jgi:hypothetical protein
MLLIKLKGQCHEIFNFMFFHESSSPKPKKNENNIRVMPNFFEIFGDIHKSRSTTGTNNTSGNDTGGTNGILRGLGETDS